MAEALPFADAAFDFALVVTTICFVDDPAATLAEAGRVLKPGGALVIGFIDRDSRLGRHYLAHQAENVFYRAATFYSAGDVARLLAAAGFATPVWRQTLVGPLARTTAAEPVRPGHGAGAFVAVRGTWPG